MASVLLGADPRMVLGYETLPSGGWCPLLEPAAASFWFMHIPVQVVILASAGGQAIRPVNVWGYYGMNMHSAFFFCDCFVAAVLLYEFLVTALGIGFRNYFTMKICVWNFLVWLSLVSSLVLEFLYQRPGLNLVFMRAPQFFYLFRDIFFFREARAIIGALKTSQVNSIKVCASNCQLTVMLCRSAYVPHVHTSMCQALPEFKR